MERKAGREGELECSAPREHATLDSIVVHVCVCMGSVVSSLGPDQGPHSARSLWLSSPEGGHSWWGHDSPGQPRERQHEQGLLNLPFYRPLAFLTATLRAKEDPNLVRNIFKKKCNHNRKISSLC